MKKDIILTIKLHVKHQWNQKKNQLKRTQILQDFHGNRRSIHQVNQQGESKTKRSAHEGCHERCRRGK